MEDNKDISSLRIEKKGLSSGRPGYRYLYIAGVAVLVLLAAWYGVAYFSAVQARSAVVAFAYPSEGLTVLNASGYVVAQRKASLASRTTGRLIWLGVEEGSRVARGQVIARIEGQDAKAAVDEALAKKGVAIKALEQARAELDEVVLSHDRNKELYSSGFIPKSDFDASDARLKKAKASFDGATAQLEATEASLASARVAYGYTEIRSPFDAVVLTKNADIGDILTPIGASATSKSAVVTVADLGSLQVEVDVSESSINLIRRDMPCELQLDAIPGERFECAVHMIVPTVDRTKAAVLIKLRFIDIPSGVLPEMSAKAAFLKRKLEKGENSPRTAVPASAVLKDGLESHVFVVNDGRAQKRKVTVGQALGDSVEISSGASPGERVVISPPPSLRDGSRLRLVEE